MVKWPDALVTEMAERRCIIFAGAGASMGSVGEDGKTHPPGWEKFLRGAVRLVSGRSEDVLPHPLSEKAST